MAGIRSNTPEIIVSVRELPFLLDLTTPSAAGGGTAGGVALDLVAERVYERTFLEQRQPDMRPLAKLEQATLVKKSRLGYPETIGVETKKMGAMAEIKGTRKVRIRSATMTYGTGEETRKKAEWFTEGRKGRGRARGKQKPRPFYELDKASEADLDDFFDRLGNYNLCRIND